MNNFLKRIEDKIKKNIQVESILVIDNSKQHKKHKFFDAEKYHLRLEVNSVYLKSLDRLSAQRIIMKTLSDELKNKIHALEIKIK
tara:strand:+ start:1009 stop:1263 length:255 start_codon:yes stop_codon:yes gene_type:complete